MRTLAISLLLVVTGCPNLGPIDQPFIPRTYNATGETIGRVVLDEARPRRRFQVRTFNNFLHPAQTIMLQVSFPVGTLDQAFVRFDTFGTSTHATYIEVRPEFAHATLFELELRSPGAEELDADLRVTASFAQEVVGPEPPLWAGTAIDIVLEEVDPGDERLAAGSGPNDEFPSFSPSRLGGCQRVHPPSPIGPAQGDVRIDTVTSSGAFVLLEGAGLRGTSSRVLFEAWSAVEVVEATDTRMQVRPPVLPNRPHQIAVETDDGVARFDDFVPFPSVVELSPWPSPVVDAQSFEGELYVGTASAVHVRSATAAQTLALPPGAELRALRRLRETENTLVVATSSGVYRAERKGDRIDPLVKVTSGNYYSLDEKGPDSVLAGGQPSLAVSRDGGFSFSSFPTAVEVRSLAVSQNSGTGFETLVADANGTVWVGRAVGGSPLRWEREEIIDQALKVLESPTTCGEWFSVTREGLWRRPLRSRQVFARTAFRLDRLAAGGARLFGAGEDGLLSWSGDEWRPVVELPEGRVTAMAATADGARIDVFIGARHFVIEPGSN